MPRNRTVQVVAISAAVGAVIAAVAVTAAGPWDAGQRTAERRSAAARDARTASHGSAAQA
ncbi:MAG: D-alanyl-D-alanine carboxypeptidase, partial [Streptomyces sp.]|nr:D-alanyl-D-alanine carboxypeptidase [Streptomyces sp.]